MPETRTFDQHQPDLDICSWCKEHASFLTDENGSFRSECCDALPISVDVDHFIGPER